jgi:hypothetical protein
MDIMPYHEKQIDKPPTKSSLKKEMLEYLEGMEGHTDKV